MEDRWGTGPEAGADAAARLAYLSNVIGADHALVQPGGGNSSIKTRGTNLFGEEEDILLVKGSGSDLATLTTGDFTRLSLHRLARLGRCGTMTDADMMEFISACMLHPHRDPLPSVETPLHAVLPGKVIVHTHDIASLSLTNLEDELARTLVEDAFGGQVAFMPYVRPGFPLARHMLDTTATLSEHHHGLALAHHGLVVWADDVESCYHRLLALVARGREWLKAKTPAVSTFGPVTTPACPEKRRHQLAAWAMPVIRKALSGRDKPILHLHDDADVLDILGRRDLLERTARGVATPEHILRSGRRPLVLNLDTDAGEERITGQTAEQMAAFAAEYQEYHQRHAQGQTPLEDWGKVVLIPGVGMVTAFRDSHSARLAGRCYRSVLEAMSHADALGGFRFIADEEVFYFEHWPLERRKVEESIYQERQQAPLARNIALILGGASGIGEAAARQFAAAGAHVVVADLNGSRAGEVAAEINSRFPHRALPLAADCRRQDAIIAAVEQTVLAFGGLDTLFYTPGLAPRFAPLLELSREDFQSQLDVHYIGALLAVQAAAAVMRRQGMGGAVVCSVSKAALAPGRQAAAYGGSKAGLQHALRVAALELGESNIRINSINADQVETPMFMKFAAARAAARGVTLEEQLAGYQERNALKASLIPAEAVADLAVLLAGDRFRYTTGDIITIDGGLGDAFPR